MEMLERMRRAREDLGLDLPALAERTRVRVHLLSAVEDGRFEELPRGVYARGVVRAYATAVGIDPNRAVTAVVAMLPELEDPLDGIARVRGFARQHESAAESGSEPAVRHPDAAAAGALAARLPTADPAVPVVVAPGAPIRPWQPAVQAASFIDSLVLAGIGCILVVLISLTAGMPVAELLDIAGPSVAILFLLIASLYFLLLAGIRGATVGTHLMRLAPERVAAPMTLGAAGRRAAAVVVRELSILVDLLLPLPAARVPGGRPAASRSGTRLAGRAAAR